MRQFILHIYHDSQGIEHTIEMMYWDVGNQEKRICQRCLRAFSRSLYQSGRRRGYGPRGKGQDGSNPDVPRTDHPSHKQCVVNNLE